MIKKVMCFGAFDLFHKGHEYFISESFKYGDELFIVVATNKNIEEVKSRKPKFSDKERCDEVKKHFPKANVILGDRDDIYSPLRQIKPDIICLGYDQKADIEKIKQELPQIIIKRIAPFKEDIYKSSMLKKNIK